MRKLFLLVLITTELFAQTCDPETNLQWILSETEASHPRLILERMNVQRIEASKAEAGKRINPEFEHFSVWGKEFGGVQAYQNETRLWFTLQLAGKRNKSLDAWAKQTEMAKHEEEMLRQSLLKDLWLNFFRMHQINAEVNVKKTLIEKLEKILARYKQRKFLSPDQSLEERIFTMVVDNFSLTLNELERERLNILSFFREITGFQCAITKINLEDSKIKWPKLNELKALDSLDTQNVKLAQFDLEFSQAQLTLADSKKTPNLRLSPVIQNYINDDVNNTMAGVSFVIPIPIFETNQTERVQSLLKQKYAENRLEVIKSKEDYFFETKLKKYERGLSVLNEIQVIDESLKRFKSLSNSFGEGKITITNIVEFCRQLEEILKRYHAGEAILMNDLLDILEQRGKLDKLTLEHLL
jgi:hypothetical protein